MYYEILVRKKIQEEMNPFYMFGEKIIWIII